MGKPMIHARASVRRYGGQVTDYLEVHEFMDGSKGAVADLRHRYLTHNAWFVRHVVERVFGLELTNSDGRQVSTRQLAEDHVEEDFGGFIPTAQDWAMAMAMEDWMRPGAGGYPPSVAGVVKQARERAIEQGLTQLDVAKQARASSEHVRRVRAAKVTTGRVD